MNEKTSTAKKKPKEAKASPKNETALTKVLFINGSPHLDQGATGSVISAFEEGMRRANPMITKKNVYELNIKPCIGCFSCWGKTAGECIQKDDMESMLPLVAETDVLILATPVYVDGMTGSLKTFLDRLIPLVKGGVELRENHMRHIPRKLRSGKMVLLSVSGFSELDNFDPLVAHIKATARNLNREYVGEVLVPSAWYLPHVKQGYDAVYDLIVSAGKSLMEKGAIPDISDRIASWVNRDEVVAALNNYYGREHGHHPLEK
jgi:multimeric flavodoxin WrbA